MVVLFAEKALTDYEIQELLFGDESGLMSIRTKAMKRNYFSQSALYSEESDDASSEDKNEKNEKLEKTPLPKGSCQKVAILENASILGTN